MWSHNAVHDTIDVRGHDLDRTKKFRDVAASGRAVIVIDDLVSIDAWQPRAVEVRGRAEAVLELEPLIRLYPSGSSLRAPIPTSPTSAAPEP
jgi:pyridoxamine 5'-phosphate oxidase family protein